MPSPPAGTKRAELAASDDDIAIVNFDFIKDQGCNKWGAQGRRASLLSCCWLDQSRREVPRTLEWCRTPVRAELLRVKIQNHSRLNSRLNRSERPRPDGTFHLPQQDNDLLLTRLEARAQALPLAAATKRNIAPRMRRRVYAPQTSAGDVVSTRLNDLSGRSARPSRGTFLPTQPASPARIGGELGPHVSGSFPCG